MEYMRRLLEGIKPLTPVDSGLESRFEVKKEIKAILFDVYGTLLISESGDIDRSTMSIENLKRALEFAGIIVPGKPGEQKLNRVLEDVLFNFEMTILRYHDYAKEKKVIFPEIDIIRVWEEVIMFFVQKKQLALTGKTDIHALAFKFEILSNNAYPMPGMKEIIGWLYLKGVPMGIISNAQFYTPVMMNYFLSEKLLPVENVDFFEDDLIAFSYKHLRAKPDQYLFDSISKVLKDKYKLYPGEVLFVGNDMYKDILPAKRTGFYAVLFAGDKRSLRLRENNPEVSNIIPDAVITHLEQLKKIIRT